MPRVESLHYYPWFWKDWRSNRRVQRMHYIARGLYRELLDEQFAEGFIPSELVAIAEVCGCPVAVMKEYWPEIEPHFVSDGHGGLIHPRMESVREKSVAKALRRIKGNQVRALARWPNGSVYPRGRRKPYGWTALRIKVFDRDKGLCRYCRAVAEHADHVIPLSRGGSDDESNLVAACAPCNLRKNDRTPEEAGMVILEIE